MCQFCVQDGSQDTPESGIFWKSYVLLGTFDGKMEIIVSACFPALVVWPSIGEQLGGFDRGDIG